MKELDRLFRGLVKGDEHLILEIYQVIYPKVLRYVKANSGEASDAMDIFQKALLQLLSRVRVKGYQPIESFEAYLFTACKNLWLKELNRPMRVTKAEKLEQVSEYFEDEMTTSVLEQERWELFQACLEKISENCRLILEQYFKKTSYKEMMLKFSYSSETTLRQRVFKCKNQLTKMVKQDLSYKNLMNK